MSSQATPAGIASAGLPPTLLSSPASSSALLGLERCPSSDAAAAFSILPGFGGGGGFGSPGTPLPAPRASFSGQLAATGSGSSEGAAPGASGSSSSRGAAALSLSALDAAAVAAASAAASAEFSLADAAALLQHMKDRLDVGGGLEVLKNLKLTGLAPDQVGLPWRQGAAGCLQFSAQKRLLLCFMSWRPPPAPCYCCCRLATPTSSS